MRCPSCGEERPSRHHFVTDTLCRSCFERLPPGEQRRLLAEAESLEGDAPRERVVAGHPLRCPVCAHGRFRKRRTPANPPGPTFLGVERAGRQAENFVCERCGHVL